MNYRLNIADIGWLLETSPLDESVSSLRFQDFSGSAHDVFLRVLPAASAEQIPQIPSKDGSPAIIGQNGAWHHYSDASWGLWVFDVFSKKPALYMRIETSWKIADALYLESEFDSAEDPVHICGDMLLRALAVMNNGFVMHASVVEYNGYAIMFAAPSGTGKTTQARLWQEHRNARILNGDRPVVRISDGIVHAYGTPWCGKEPLFEVAQAPVCALFLLEQALENTVTRLPLKTSLTKTMARVFLPLQDTELVSKGMTHVGEFIQKVPVYRLQCRPDVGAVEVVEACLKLS